MGTYRKEWNCCGSVTETDGWEPEACPFCRTPVADGAALRWKFNGIAGLKPYLTDKQYQAQTPGTKKWYDPICDRCGPDDGAALDLPPLPQPAFHTQHGYVYLAEQVEQIRREAISHYLRKQAGQVGEPLDMPLPCDITTGNVTIRKGCKLRTLVTRMESLHRMAVAAMPKLSPEEQRANWNALLAATASASQPRSPHGNVERHFMQPEAWSDGQEGEQPTINKGEN